MNAYIYAHIQVYTHTYNTGVYIYTKEVSVEWDVGDQPDFPPYDIDIYMYTYIHIYLYTNVYVCLYMCTHVYIYIYIHIYTHICTYIYIYS